jgi:glycosyltransferase involved in cell wall biosynthesis
LHFKIIIPLYNVEEWIKVCIRSVKAQSYTDFQCIILDDMSTDNSAAIIKKEIANNDKFILVENKEKALALKNICDGINISIPSPEDVIVTLDGDDWLANKNVLQTLKNTYEQKDCLITYGSYAEYPSGAKGKFARKIPQQVIENNSFRSAPWCSSHLRTFKYKLWEKINKKDLLDTKGSFYKMAWDLAFMLPMLEMASDRSQYIEEVLYVYNVANPLNDHKVNNSYQIALEREIRAKKKYTCLSPFTRAVDLMNSNRFDIAAKTFFARIHLKDTKSRFHEELYLQHLKVWNNFHEVTPIKEGANTFLSSFKSILDSIQSNGFREDISKVPVINNSAINGAHRIGACIALNKNIKTYVGHPSEGQHICNYKYFKNKTNFVAEGLVDKYTDEMALEFCRNKSNLYTITLFPSHTSPIANLISIIEQKYGIIYKKEIKLTERGKFNYIHNLYYDEKWIGNKLHNYPGIREKTNLCFTQGNEIVVLLIEENNIKNLITLKEQLRDLCKVSNHSVHINDTQAETWRIATSVFNKNTIEFLNKRSLSPTVNFDNYLNTYINTIHNRPDKEDFCIDSSAVLSAYGHRDCRDLDFLHLNNIHSIAYNIDCHNQESHHYLTPKDEIIYNPDFHFYFHGIKFASLDVVKKMKENRDEEKDRKDVILIKGNYNEDK